MTGNSITFPAADRVIYDNNPIKEVVCQLRFPQILRITSEPPAAFQEKIRGKFPEYTEEPSVFSTSGVPRNILELMAGSTMAKRHRFDTRDGKLSVRLDGQNLTFITNDYSRWEEFSLLVFETIDAFLEEYSPTFLSRIGLRYLNAITISREALGLPLVACLRPELLGVLIDDAWLDHTFEFQTALRCHLERAQDRLLLQSGLEDDETQGKLFKLDFDYYIEDESEPENASAIINRLHGYSGPAFRWAISDALHEILGPRIVDQGARV